MEKSTKKVLVVAGVTITLGTGGFIGYKVIKNKRIRAEQVRCFNADNDIIRALEQVKDPDMYRKFNKMYHDRVSDLSNANSDRKFRKALERLDELDDEIEDCLYEQANENPDNKEVTDKSRVTKFIIKTFDNHEQSDVIKKNIEKGSEYPDDINDLVSEKDYNIIGNIICDALVKEYDIDIEYLDQNPVVSSLIKLYLIKCKKKGLFEEEETNDTKEEKEVRKGKKNKKNKKKDKNKKEVKEETSDEDETVKETNEENKEEKNDTKEEKEVRKDKKKKDKKNKKNKKNKKETEEEEVKEETNEVEEETSVEDQEETVTDDKENKKEEDSNTKEEEVREDKKKKNKKNKKKNKKNKNKKMTKEETNKVEEEKCEQEHEEEADTNDKENEKEEKNDTKEEKVVKEETSDKDETIKETNDKDQEEAVTNDEENEEEKNDTKEEKEIRKNKTNKKDKKNKKKANKVEKEKCERNQEAVATDDEEKEVRKNKKRNKNKKMTKDESFKEKDNNENEEGGCHNEVSNTTDEENCDDERFDEGLVKDICGVKVDFTDDDEDDEEDEYVEKDNLKKLLFNSTDEDDEDEDVENNVEPEIVECPTEADFEDSPRTAYFDMIEYRKDILNSTTYNIKERFHDFNDSIQILNTKEHYGYYHECLEVIFSILSLDEPEEHTLTRLDTFFKEFDRMVKPVIEKRIKDITTIAR